jgi:hypothetical protein
MIWIGWLTKRQFCSAGSSPPVVRMSLELAPVRGVELRGDGVMA